MSEMPVQRTYRVVWGVGNQPHSGTASRRTSLTARVSVAACAGTRRPTGFPRLSRACIACVC
jgi:hypothetical protein